MNNYLLESAARQAPIDAAVAEFLSRGGRIKVEAGPPEKQQFSKRKDWIDPETVLARRRNVQRSATVREFDRQIAEREQLRKMAGAI